MVTIAKSLGVKGGWSVDRLCEKAPGEPWNLTLRSHQLQMLIHLQTLEFQQFVHQRSKKVVAHGVFVLAQTTLHKFLVA